MKPLYVGRPDQTRGEVKVAFAAAKNNAKITDHLDGTFSVDGTPCRLTLVGVGGLYAFAIVEDEEWCRHERLNEEGICRACGRDCRGIG